MKVWARGIGLGCLAAGLSGCGFFPANSTTATKTGTSTTGDYVYALNPTSNTISGYAVGTGTLTGVSGTAYTLPTGFTSAGIPGAIAVSGSNSYVYVAGNGSIYGYAIGTGGALTALSSGAALVTVNCSSLDASPDGNWLVGLDNSVGTVGQIDIFQIATATGLLTAGTSVAPTGKYTGAIVPRSIRFSPLGGYILASLGTAGNAVFTFNTSNGAIANLAALNPNTTTVGYNAGVVNKTDTALYMTSTSGVGPTLNGALAYTLSTSGETPNGSLVASGASGAQTIVLDSTGGYLYVGGADATISEFSFVNGIPSLLSGSPLSTRYAVNSLVRDNSGKYILAGLALTGSVTSDLAMYQISNTTTGTLASVVSVATNTSTPDTIGLLIAATH